MIANYIENLLEDAPVKVRDRNLHHFLIVFSSESDRMLFLMRWL
jgi:hypothetical protein